MAGSAMTRLPPRPDIAFREDGTPVATGHEDVYFSVEDGLAESRAVFLAGCGLPEAWAGRERFTVAELGFGTGLNVLALWQMWRAHRPSPGAWLHVVSFEGYPLDRETARRALSRWPELSELAERLLSRWPERVRGVQQVVFPDDGVTLTLYTDDIGVALPGAAFRADAWFLDGFSPARNPDMWSADVFAAIAERSNEGARLATFTVAGAVRRGLSEAGFTVEKCPGHGRKRERLEARFAGRPVRGVDLYGLEPETVEPRRIAVLGAGIAGSTFAAMARERGLSPVVFDLAEGPGAGASGNPLALVHPRYDAADTVQARVQLAAALAAGQAYAGRAGANALEVAQLAKDEADQKRIATLANDPPTEMFRVRNDRDGVVLDHLGLGFVIRPDVLLPGLLDGVETRFGPVSLDLAHRSVNGERFDHVVIATGMGLGEFGLPLTPRAGQVEFASDDGAPFARVRSNYAVRQAGRLVFGATFDPGTDGRPEAEARAENVVQFQGLCPEIGTGDLTSRVSVRATTPDRLPFAGALPDRDQAPERLSVLRHGGEPTCDLPVVAGVSVIGGLGSRGFTFAPLLASLVLARLTGAPLPVSRAEAEALAPARFLIRDLKRGRV